MDENGEPIAQPSGGTSSAFGAVGDSVREHLPTSQQLAGLGKIVAGSVLQVGGGATAGVGVAVAGGGVLTTPEGIGVPLVGAGMAMAGVGVAVGDAGGKLVQQGREEWYAPPPSPQTPLTVTPPPVVPVPMGGPTGTIPGGMATGGAADAPTAPSVTPSVAPSAATNTGTSVRVDLGDLGLGGSGAAPPVAGSVPILDMPVLGEGAVASTPSGTGASGSAQSPLVQGSATVPAGQVIPMTGTGPVWDGSVSTPILAPLPQLPGYTPLPDAGKQVLDQPETLPLDPNAGTPQTNVTYPTPALPNTLVTTPTPALPSVFTNQVNKVDQTTQDIMNGKNLSGGQPPIELDHIFEGEISAGRRGLQAKGFHHAPGDALHPNAEVSSINIAGKPNRFGVYEATVNIVDPATGQTYQKMSTMFPDSLSRDKVVQAIRNAYNNASIRQGNKFEGPSGLGFDIRGYTSGQGANLQIRTAFPLYVP